MQAWLQQILADIGSGKLLPAAYFQDLDCDAALDARDSNSQFDGDWSRCYKDLQQRWPAAEVGQEERKLVDDIRRDSFLAVSRATQQHEIASYVSDDFELILHSKLLDVADPLVEHLWDSYSRGEFPVPPL